MRSPRPNSDRAGTHLHAHTNGVSIGFVARFPTFPLADQRERNAVEAFEEAHHFLCVFTAVLELHILDPIQ